MCRQGLKCDHWVEVAEAVEIVDFEHEAPEDTFDFDKAVDKTKYNPGSRMVPEKGIPWKSL